MNRRGFLGILTLALSGCLHKSPDPSKGKNLEVMQREEVERNDFPVFNSSDPKVDDPFIQKALKEAHEKQRMAYRLNESTYRTVTEINGGYFYINYKNQTYLYAITSNSTKSK